MESYALLFAATLSAGTVLAIAGLGLLINEKAGIVNLGAEGMLLCAAIAGFATVVHTGNTWLGFAAGMAAGAVLAAIFGVLVIWLNTNQYATGLALSLFGVGFSAFAGIPYVQAKLPERTPLELPLLGDLLASKKGEGILSATYSATGNMEQPTISTNPLAMLAPGIFRRIFEGHIPRAPDAPSNAQPPAPKPQTQGQEPTPKPAAN